MSKRDDNWRPMSEAPTDLGRFYHKRRVFLSLTNGTVAVGWHDSDQYAKKPRPYWVHTGSASIDRANVPVAWMPLPEHSGFPCSKCGELPGSDGLCPSCGVECERCAKCHGVGYHADGCTEAA